MRLTFVMGTDLRTGRGSEKTTMYILKYRPVDVQVTVVETDFYDKIRLSEDFVREFTNGCKIIKIHRAPYFSKNIFQRILEDLVIRPELKEVKRLQDTDRLMEIRDTDVVYLVDNRFASLFSGLNIPVIASNQGDDFTVFITDRSIIVKTYYRLIYRLYYKNVNGLHVFPRNSQLLDKIDSKYRIRHKMSLASGTDCAVFFPDCSVHNKKIKFLFVAALNPEKGLDILLPLINRIQDDVAEFHIAGSGPLEDEIRNNSKIVYHGTLKEDDLAKLYRECDVFIYPTHADTFGLVIVEALASGLYVLTSEYLRGVFDDFEGKYLEYLPLYQDSFYSRITQIINDRNIIEHDKMEEYGLVKSRYDWSVIANEFYNYMRKFSAKNEIGSAGRIE